MKEYKGHFIVNKQKIKYLLYGVIIGGGIATAVFYPQIQILKKSYPTTELLKFNYKFTKIKCIREED